MCEMKETRPGVFKRAGSIPFEIEASKSDSNSCLLDTVILKLNSCEPKTKMSFFKLNGTRILNEDLIIDGNKRKWTLGNYLRVIKRSPGRLMLGYGSLATMNTNTGIQLKVVCFFM